MLSSWASKPHPFWPTPFTISVSTGMSAVLLRSLSESAVASASPSSASGLLGSPASFCVGSHARKPLSL
jgi:hypothetical protein